MRISFQPMNVLTGSPDTEGLLVTADGYLVAVLVRLGALHDDLEGSWFVEASMGISGRPPGDVFHSLEHAVEWITAHVRAPKSA